MKPASILAISAFYNDSAACLIHDGAIVAATPEKRLSRNEHAQRLLAETDSDHRKQIELARAELLPIAFSYGLPCQGTVTGAPGV